MKVILALFGVLCVSIEVWGQTQEVDSLKGAFYSLPLDTNRIQIGLRLAEKLITLGNFGLADSIVKTIRHQSESQAYPYGIAKCKLMDGMIYYRSNKFEDAMVTLQQSAVIFEQINRQEQLGQVYSWIANVHYARSNYDLALSFHLKALANREIYHDQRGIGQSLHNIALIYVDQKDYDKALEYNERSLKIKQELRDLRGIGNSYNNMALIYSNLNQLDLAEKYFAESLKLFKELNFRLGVAYSTGNLGEVYEKKKDYPKAIKTLDQAVKLLTEIGDKKAMAEAYNHLGSVHTMRREFEVAEKDLHRANALAEDVDAKSELIANYLAHSQLDSARGRIPASFEWFKKYSVLQGSVFNSEKSKQIARMEANFDSEKKDQQISLLKAENELEHNKKDNQLILSVIVVTTLLMLSLALFFTIRQKQKTNKVLIAQKEYLDELNHLKDKLFSVISHDLRSPLNSLQGLMYLIENNMVSEQELKANLMELSKSTRSMSDLIDNLLYWAKSNLHREVIEKQRFDLSNLVDKNVKLFRQQALEKHISITSPGPEKQIVSGDENMIDLVVRNLLSNAIKFTSDHGQVSISLQQKDRQITLSIKDNGIGLPAERVQRLFSTQNSSTRGTNNEKGTGLGLLLCKDFVEKNGGRIWVESKPGEGSTFSFRLAYIE